MTRLTVRGLAREIPHLGGGGASAGIAGGDIYPTLPTITGALAGWSVHEAYATKRYQTLGGDLAASDGDVLGAVLPLTGAVNATQTTTAAKPLLRTGTNGINGHDAALFDGSDDFWNIPITSSSGPYTFYVVCSPTHVAGGQYLIDIEIGRLVITYTGFSTGTYSFFNSVSWINISPSAVGDQILSYVLGSGVGTIYKNGTNLGNGSYVDLAIGGGVKLGSNYTGSGQRLAGKVGEAHVYNAEHSPSERQEMEAYLSELWGISLA